MPWRCAEAESLLAGKAATREQFEQAAGVVVRDATPQSENAFKIELARRCLIHALTTVTTAA